MGIYKYSYTKLKELASTERGLRYAEKLKFVYEKEYKDRRIPTLNYSDFKSYYIDGNRVRFQNGYFDKRKRLMVLQILSIAENKYIPELEEILAAICDEFSWVVSAHNYVESEGCFDYTMIDLFSAETAMYLAETVYVFGDKLSKDIRQRVYTSIKTKIIGNYERRNFWWETSKYNWSAVCSCGIGLAYLYLFPERFNLVKHRLLSSFECYLKGLGSEGYCEEGYSYWVYGFGFFSVFYDVYLQLVEDKCAILEKDIIGRTLQYGKVAVLDKNIFLPFADGGSKGEHDEAALLCVIESLFECNLHIAEEELYLPSSQALGFRVLYKINDNFKTLPQRQETVFYKESQVFIHRNKNYVFAVKGGHNGEPHNHNDLGAFTIIKNNKQLIADLGVGEYIKAYFTDMDIRCGEEIFVCGSSSHSVPIVDNIKQLFGAKNRAKVLKQTDKSIALDISGAYGKVDDSIIVEYSVKDNSVCASYDCKNIQEGIIFRFVSLIQPKIENGKVWIDNMQIVSSCLGIPIIQRREYSKYLGEKEIAYTIDYCVRDVKNIQTKFLFEL